MLLKQISKSNNNKSNNNKSNNNKSNNNKSNNNKSNNNKSNNNKSNNNKSNNNKSNNNKSNNNKSVKTEKNKEKLEFNKEILDKLRLIYSDSDLRNINNYLKTNILTQKKINETIKDIEENNNKKDIYNKIYNDLEKIKNKYISNILKLFNYKDILEKYLKKSEIGKKYVTKPQYKADWNEMEKKIENNFNLNETEDYLNNKYTTNYNLELFKYVYEKIFNINYSDLKNLSELKNIKTKTIKITTKKEFEIDNYKISIDNKKKIEYIGTGLNKIDDKYYFLLPIIADILSSIINNEEYLLLNYLKNEKDLLKNIKSNISIKKNKYN